MKTLGSILVALFVMAMTAFLSIKILALYDLVNYYHSPITLGNLLSAILFAIFSVCGTLILHFSEPKAKLIAFGLLGLCYFTVTVYVLVKGIADMANVIIAIVPIIMTSICITELAITIYRKRKYEYYN